MEAKFYRRLFLCGALVLAAARVDAADNPIGIELRCRIVPSSRGVEPQIWIIELKAVTGTIVRATKAVDGQTVRFKSLDPGIYTACIIGSLNRIHCESVDLNPPGGGKLFQAKMELKTSLPVLNQDDLHTISSRQLAVPQAARDELDRAQLAEFHGKEQEAVRHLKSALEMDPAYDDAWNNLGIHYHRDGEYEKAIECFTKASQLNPDNYGAWTNLSASLLAVSKFGEALEASTHAYQLRPGEPLVLAYYAKSLFYLHNYREAKKYFEKVAELDPKNSTYPQLSLARIALLDGDAAGAKKLLTEFVQLHPYLPEVANYRELAQLLDSGALANPSEVASSGSRPAQSIP
jgi:Flp pilus assembly protein TadD